MAIHQELVLGDAARELHACIHIGEPKKAKQIVCNCLLAAVAVCWFGIP